MSDWKPTEEYRRIADANRRYYATSASQYDATECCVSDARLQKRLEDDLDEALALIGRNPSTIHALDACGGSGNISLKLLRRRVDVTLVDVSSDLQEIFRRKCAASGFTPQTVLAEVGDFLAETDRTFDLIVFSSALHHLESIEPVLSAAFHRLRPNGLLFTTFDPTLQESLRPATRLLQRGEYVAFKLFCQTRDLPRAIFRRMRRVISGTSPRDKSLAALDDSTAGMLAEYHIERGIDDLALVKRLEAVGYQVASHRRYIETRFRLTRRFIEKTGDVTHFKLLLRKPAS
jgi:2-polyprenyl-3-methyl-5-hydroxy-6-metoxy-1,4-benzoquinol methylase